MIQRRCGGFSLVELIAILIILGIVGGSLASSGVFNSTSLNMQSSRDQVVSAFFMAQQLAMATDETVTLRISSPNIIDVRINGSSATLGGVSFPLALGSNQTLSVATFTFDRLGKTSANSLTLAEGSNSVQINISSTGYVN